MIINFLWLNLKTMSLAHDRFPNWKVSHNGTVDPNRSSLWTDPCRIVCCQIIWTPNSSTNFFRLQRVLRQPSTVRKFPTLTLMLDAFFSVVSFRLKYYFLGMLSDCRFHRPKSVQWVYFGSFSVARREHAVCKAKIKNFLWIEKIFHHREPVNWLWKSWILLKTKSLTRKLRKTKYLCFLKAHGEKSTHQFWINAIMKVR